MGPWRAQKEFFLTIFVLNARFYLKFRIPTGPIVPNASTGGSTASNAMFAVPLLPSRYAICLRKIFLVLKFLLKSYFVTATLWALPENSWEWSTLELRSIPTSGFLKIYFWKFVPHFTLISYQYMWSEDMASPTDAIWLLCTRPLPLLSNYASGFGAVGCIVEPFPMLP